MLYPEDFYNGEYYTLRDIANMCCVDYKTVTRWFADGKLPTHYRAGKKQDKIIFGKKGVDDYVTQYMKKQSRAWAYQRTRSIPKKAERKIKNPKIKPEDFGGDDLMEQIEGARHDRRQRRRARLEEAGDLYDRTPSTDE